MTMFKNLGDIVQTVSKTVHDVATKTSNQAANIEVSDHINNLKNGVNSALGYLVNQGAKAYDLVDAQLHELAPKKKTQYYVINRFNNTIIAIADSEQEVLEKLNEKFLTELYRFNEDARKMAVNELTQSLVIAEITSGKTLVFENGKFRGA